MLVPGRSVPLLGRSVAEAAGVLGWRTDCLALAHAGVAGHEDGPVDGEGAGRVEEAVVSVGASLAAVVVWFEMGSSVEDLLVAVPGQDGTGLAERSRRAGQARMKLRRWEAAHVELSVGFGPGSHGSGAAISCWLSTSGGQPTVSTPKMLPNVSASLATTLPLYIRRIRSGAGLDDTASCMRLRSSLIVVDTGRCGKVMPPSTSAEGERILRVMTRSSSAMVSSDDLVVVCKGVLEG